MTFLDELPLSLQIDDQFEVHTRRQITKVESFELGDEYMGGTIVDVFYDSSSIFCIIETDTECWMEEIKLDDKKRIIYSQPLEDIETLTTRVALQ